ncbi:MAG: choice-of-anchor J domain-containing protein [Oligoflexales bacterium]|nr:choice-of-anchor J domain-containing protein [Oligoflexales bacterium]
MFRASKRIFSLGLAALLLLVASCDSGKDNSNRNDEVTGFQLDPDSPEFLNQVTFAEMILLTESLENELSQGVLLRSSTDTDEQTFKTLLYNIRVGLFMLIKDQKDRRAFELLKDSLGLRQNFMLLAIDQTRVESLFSGVSAILVRHFSLTSNVLDQEQLYWTLFRQTFSSGVAPFLTFASSSEWMQDFALDKTFVKVKSSRDNKSWLISPAFDLSKVAHPKFRIKHLTIVDANDRENKVPFDRQMITREVFKAFVSTDFKGGEPEFATWKQVDLGPMPLGSDFHTVYSADVDISKFVGPSVSIAFVFDQQVDKHGQHYLTWQIEDFKLMGAAQNFEFKEVKPADTLYDFAFTKSSLAPYKNLDLDNAGVKWEPFGFQSGASYSYKFAKIGSMNRKSDTWLLSPQLDLNGVEDPRIKITHTVRNPNWEKFKVKISADYKGGDPRESSWTELNITPKQAIAADSWIDLVSPSIEIKEFVNKKIVIAFQFSAEASDNFVWEIGTIKITGIGEKIKTNDYRLNLVGTDFEAEEEVIEDTCLDALVGENAESYVCAFSQNFAGGLGTFEQKVISADAAKFLVDEANKKLKISGFKDKNEGKQLLFSAPIDLTGKAGAQIRLNQMINFYRDFPTLPPESRLIKIMLQDSTVTKVEDLEAWQIIDFAKKPMGSNYDSVLSEWLDLPENLQGKSLRVGFLYESKAPVFPAWDLFGVAIRSKK